MQPETPPRKPRWNFDIDRFLNPFIIPPPRKHLPSILRRFLGYHDHPQQPLGNVPMMIGSFTGTLAALSLIFVVCRQIPTFEDRGAPVILGSFGAAAVLEFYAIDSPLSQPRNMLLGQLISSVIGVAINKGFARASSPRHSELRWLAGALSCACSTVAMSLTGTVHPPAGATALLAATDDSVAGLGWVLVPVVMLSCALMLVVALLVNNVLRAFPAYWWTADEVGSFWACGRDESGVPSGNGETKATRPKGQDSGSIDEELGEFSPGDDFPLVTVAKRGISVPSNVHLRLEERLCLEGLRRRL